MAKDDYAVATGGSLKLKGVKDGKIEKKRKKKKRDQPTEAIDKDANPTSPVGQDQVSSDEVDGDEKEERESAATYVGKTETERRHGEMRRKRLNDRIKREGVKRLAADDFPDLRP